MMFDDVEQLYSRVVKNSNVGLWCRSVEGIALWHHFSTITVGPQAASWTVSHTQAYSSDIFVNIVLEIMLIINLVTVKTFLLLMKSLLCVCVDSCFLLAMQEDSIEGIYDTLKQCALISKNAGGVGLHVHCIRASGSFIAGVGWLALFWLRFCNSTRCMESRGALMTYWWILGWPNIGA